ncbi:MAG: aldehyde dehydrogenase family protein, partial [Methylophagaceae bacterium]
MQYFPLLIAGRTKKNDHSLDVTSPFDDSLIATVETANIDDIEQALATASALFADRKRWLPASERIAILDRAVAIMEDRAEELATESAREGGKPLIDSRVEMARCIDSLRTCVDTLRSDCSKPVPMGINGASQHRLTMMKKEPIGV